MKYLTAFIAFFLSLGLHAETQDAAEVLRVGGDFTVMSIDIDDTGTFRVEFNAKKPTGRFDTLILETDHVHFAVREGQTIRLSAEVISENKDTAEVSQVLLFLPTQEGKTPVWMLSKKGSVFDLRGSKYLEMHAPINDYVVL